MKLSNMKTYFNLEVVVIIVGIVLYVDFMSYLWWSASRQLPQDGFYVGTITEHIIKALK
jgi:hypothetical protein